jgi:preprotein translocase subunit SecA
LEYDDVLNKHRSVIYRKRRDILELTGKVSEENERLLKQRVLETLEGELEHLVMTHTAAEQPSEWDLEMLKTAVKALFPPTVSEIVVPSSEKVIEGKLDLAAYRTSIIESVMTSVRAAYAAMEEGVGDAAIMSEIEKAIFIRAIDDAWIAHLQNIDHLRHGIGLQGYGQRDPLVEYKREAFRLFNELLASINRTVSSIILRVQVSKEAPQHMRPQTPLFMSGPAKEGAPRREQATESTQPSAFKDVGRNDACPCGSGKKYKKCHGA